MPSAFVRALEEVLGMARQADKDRATSAAQTAMAAEGYLPHGAFTLHCGPNSIDYDGNPTLHVICACGRGYAFGQRAESATLLRFLADHDSDPRAATDA